MAGGDSLLGVEATVRDIDIGLALLVPISTAWTAWQTVWTGSVSNPSLGNGISQGSYKIVGNFMWWWFSITMGSTTTFGSGTYSFTFPLGNTIKTGSSGGSSITSGLRDNSGANQNVGFGAYLDGGSTFDIRAHSTNPITPAVPWAWAQSDFIRAWGFNELP